MCVVCALVFWGVCFIVVYYCLRFGVNCSLSGVRWLMLVDTCCGLLLVVACRLLVVGCSLLVVHGWLLVVGSSFWGCW